MRPIAFAAIALLMAVNWSSPLSAAQAEVPELPTAAYPTVSTSPDESAWVFFLNGTAPVVVRPVGTPVPNGTFSLVAILTGYRMGPADQLRLEIDQVSKVLNLFAGIDDDVGNDTASVEFRAQVGVEYILHVAGQALRFNPLVSNASCVVEGEHPGCPEPLCFLPFSCEGVPNPCVFPFVC